MDSPPLRGLGGQKRADAGGASTSPPGSERASVRPILDALPAHPTRPASGPAGRIAGGAHLQSLLGQELDRSRRGRGAARDWVSDVAGDARRHWRGECVRGSNRVPHQRSVPPRAPNRARDGEPRKQPRQRELPSPRPATPSVAGPRIGGPLVENEARRVHVHGGRSLRGRPRPRRRLVARRRRLSLRLHPGQAGVPDRLREERGQGRDEDGVQRARRAKTQVR